MLFNEPKLLKSSEDGFEEKTISGFSALQRAEIAEIDLEACLFVYTRGFSALQRAEIAEIEDQLRKSPRYSIVSVLFNEPKLLKSENVSPYSVCERQFQCSSTSRNC